jgi:hypothetical protein
MPKRSRGFFQSRVLVIKTCTYVSKQVFEFVLANVPPHDRALVMAINVLLHKTEHAVNHEPNVVTQLPGRKIWVHIRRGVMRIIDVMLALPFNKKSAKALNVVKVRR